MLGLFSDRFMREVTYRRPSNLKPLNISLAFSNEHLPITDVTSTIVSSLGAKLFSTSSFIRLNIMGRKSCEKNKQANDQAEHETEFHVC